MLDRSDVTMVALVIIGFLCTDCLAARRWSESIAATQTLDGSSMVYRTFLPENYDPNISYPLVLFLHGSGERGNDNRAQVANHISGLINKTETDYPAILVAPQAPSSTSWSTPSTRELTEDMLEQIMADFNVDPNRLYLTGLSMGGFGTIGYLDYYTNDEPGLFQFAAATPMSSGIGRIVDLSQSDPWQDTPIWLIHGDRDGVVPVELSRNAFRSFTGLRPEDPIDFNSTAFNGQPTAIVDNVRYTEVVRGGHAIWKFLYANDRFYDWMFAQSLSVPEPTSLFLAWIGLGALCRFRLTANRRHVLIEN